jgi:anti-sigma factor RsiW
MNDPWTERLSEYLDGGLAPDEQEMIECHLAHCEACTAVLTDLKRVAGRARALDDHEPEADLWPAIAARIGVTTPATGVKALPRRRAGRRWSFTMTELAAAGVALMVASGGAAWLMLPRGAAPGTGPGVVPRHAAAAIPAAATTRPMGYDGAVADLERVLAQGRGRLDSATVRVIERNLVIIDNAITQAQRAVAADSANVYLNSHLAATMRRKLELLRQAASLVSAAS